MLAGAMTGGAEGGSPSEPLLGAPPAKEESGAAGRGGGGGGSLYRLQRFLQGTSLKAAAGGLFAERKWRQIWNSYQNHFDKRRTLGVSIRGAVGCVLAGLLVNIPSIYESFPPQSQVMLCNAVVMITFCVGDTFGETMSWCVSGVIGALVAFCNYRVMSFLMSFSFLESHPSLRSGLVVVEFFAFSFLVNLSETSYMARQMALGYYASYALCILNPACDEQEAMAGDLWTIFGALICVVVMLFPPARLAQARTVGGDADIGTLGRLARAVSRGSTLIMAAYITLDEQDGDAQGSTLDPSDQGGVEGPSCLHAAGTLIHSALGQVDAYLQVLEADHAMAWWEPARLDPEIMRKFIQMARDIEGYLAMQKQALFLAQGASARSRGGGEDAEFERELRADLFNATAKGARLLAVVCDVIQADCRLRHARAPDGRGPQLDASLHEARQLSRELGHSDLMISLAQHNISKLHSIGEGRNLFVFSMVWHLYTLRLFALELCDAVSNETATGEVPARRRVLSGVDGFVMLLTKLVHAASARVRAALAFSSRPPKACIYSVKATLALTFSFVMSAYWFNFDSMSVSATAYILAAPGRDARSLGGTIWKAFCRVIGVFVGGVLPGHIHNMFVPASGLAGDCPVLGHFVNSIGSATWVFCGIHLYKVNNMICTQYGHYGYVGLVMAFIAGEQFLIGCNNRVAVGDFLAQTVGGSWVLLLIECVVAPQLACLSIQDNFAEMLERQAWLVSHGTLTDLVQAEANAGTKQRRQISPASSEAPEKLGRFGAVASVLGFADSPEAKALTYESDCVWSSGVQWRLAEEIQWLARHVEKGRSDIDQAMTEDTFKLGHLFYLWMPQGYQGEAFRADLYTKVLEHIQQAHMNAIFTLCAREVDRVAKTFGEPLPSRLLQAAAPPEAVEGRGGASGEEEEEPHPALQWQQALQEDMDSAVECMEGALCDLKQLVLHSLRYETEKQVAMEHGRWAFAEALEGHNLSIETTAALLVQRAARPDAGANGKATLGQARAVFESVLDLVSHELTPQEREEHWRHFEQHLAEGGRESMSSEAVVDIVERVLGDLAQVGGHSKPATGQLDRLLRSADRILARARRGGRRRDAKNLLALFNGHSDERLNELCTHILYRLAMLDSMILFALNVRRLCDVLGHQPKREGHGSSQDFADAPDGGQGGICRQQ